MTITIYTDGACSGNPGPGGWAWAIENGTYKSGAEKRTTNQRMELMAVLDALRSNEGPLEIVSDSTYVVNCFRDKWYAGWLKRGWVNSKNQPVANRDIWEPLIDNFLARKNVKFRWVKGHSGHPMNDLVDRLAVEAGKAGLGSAGGSSPVQEQDDRGGLNEPQKDPALIKASSPGSTYVVIFRAKRRRDSDASYATIGERLRTLALQQFGCTDFQAVTEGDYEVALSYWPDEASIAAWKKQAEHVLAQNQGRKSFYESYRVEVAQVGRSYGWPDPS